MPGSIIHQVRMEEIVNRREWIRKLHERIQGGRKDQRDSEEDRWVKSNHHLNNKVIFKEGQELPWSYRYRPIVTVPQHTHTHLLIPPPYTTLHTAPLIPPHSPATPLTYPPLLLFPAHPSVPTHCSTFMFWSSLRIRISE